MEPPKMPQPQPHDIVTCPYNSSHQVQHYRMHIHLQKCRKSYPMCSKVTCPFDATHIINEVEMDYHVSVCSKRDMLDSQVFRVEDNQPSTSGQSSAVAASVDPTEELWEDDNVESYKPDPTKKGSHIIVKVKGATPSQRRKARMEGIKNYRPPENQ